MCTGILDRQAFRGCGSKQPRIGRHEDERCQACSDQARVAFESGRKLEGIIRPQRVLLQQLSCPLDNACAQIYNQVLTPCMAVYRSGDRRQVRRTTPLFYRLKPAAYRLNPALGVVMVRTHPVPGSGT
jgi:hypothetical protein